MQKVLRTVKTNNLENVQNDVKIGGIKKSALVEPNLPNILQSMPHVLVSSDGIDFSKTTHAEARLLKAEMIKYSQVFQMRTM